MQAIQSPNLLLQASSQDGIVHRWQLAVSLTAFAMSVHCALTFLKEVCSAWRLKRPGSQAG